MRGEQGPERAEGNDQTKAQLVPMIRRFLSPTFGVTTFHTRLFNERMRTSNQRLPTCIGVLIGKGTSAVGRSEPCVVNAFKSLAIVAEPFPSCTFLRQSHACVWMYKLEASFRVQSGRTSNPPGTWHPCHPPS